MTISTLKKYNIRAKKSLGQNFLIDEEILQKIASFVTIEWKNIIEVWPWYGALSEKIIQKSPACLELIELDSVMVNILNQRIHDGELWVKNIHFEIKNQDIRDYYPDFHNYSVVANIPYYITSPILSHFIYNVSFCPDEMLILMQKDVWEKILWYGRNKSSVLRLFIQKKYHPKELLFVGKESFFPPPKVDSIVLWFEKHNIYESIDDTIFLKLIKVWFSSNRKKLLKNFVSWGFEKNKIQEIFLKNQIDENTRGEDINIDIWCKIISDFILFFHMKG